MISWTTPGRSPARRRAAGSVSERAALTRSTESTSESGSAGQIQDEVLVQVGHVSHAALPGQAHAAPLGLVTHVVGPGAVVHLGP